MKQVAFLLAACCLVVVGCQPQPVVINEECHHDQRPIVIDRRPIVVQPRPIFVDGCTHQNHCGRYGCPVCRENGWYRCTPHDHCGCCPHCRANGWGVGIQIGPHGIGIGVR